MTIQELVKKQEEYNRINNEGGEGYNPYDALIDAESERLAKIPKWTKEQTIANRAAWNTSIKKIISECNGGAVPAGRVGEMENKMGFTLASLKCEISKWGL